MNCVWLSLLKLLSIFCYRAVAQEKVLASASAILATKEPCALNAWMSSLSRLKMKRTPYVSVSHSYSTDTVSFLDSSMHVEEVTCLRHYFYV